MSTTSTITAIRYPHTTTSSGPFGFCGLPGEPVMWVSRVDPPKRDIGTIRLIGGEWTFTPAGDVHLPLHIRVALEVAARKRYERSVAR
ncbi:hypothetical protein AB0I28_19755 [Phytomonospora sp. NPDC050363]|uniref:hypothetical protein n=1 Tax=Phytomonospora sp. NPDC050363 TaxID=3155642 RepID=UPI00340F5186